MYAYCMAPQLCYLVHLQHGVKDTGLFAVSTLYISKLIVCALNAGHIIFHSGHAEYQIAYHGVELCVQDEDLMWASICCFICSRIQSSKVWKGYQLRIELTTVN